MNRGWRFCRPLPYHLATAPIRVRLFDVDKSKRQMERETGFEPATSTLARSHSTTELLPHKKTDSATLAYRSFPFPPGTSWAILEHNATLSQLITNAVSFSKVSVAAGCFTVADQFFNLFDDFRGYVNFFLLQDLVEENHSVTKFWHPFNGFDNFPLPNNIEEYQAYKTNVIDFVTARNQRILNSIQ